MTLLCCVLLWLPREEPRRVLAMQLLMHQHCHRRDWHLSSPSRLWWVTPWHSLHWLEAVLLWPEARQRDFEDSHPWLVSHQVAVH